MLELTKDWDFDAVGGLTMGADPIAAAMLHAAAAAGRQLDAFVVRKEAKAHGLQRRIEGPVDRGPPRPGRRGHVHDGRVPADRAGGGARSRCDPVGVATIADRATGAAEKIEAEGVPYRFAYSLERPRPLARHPRGCVRRSAASYTL